MKGYLFLSKCVTKKWVGACGVVCVRDGMFNWDVCVTQSVHSQRCLCD